VWNEIYLSLSLRLLKRLFEHCEDLQVVDPVVHLVFETVVVVVVVVVVV
jgi:hypothetical protein